MDLSQQRQDPLNGREETLRLFDQRILMPTHTGIFIQQNLEARLRFFLGKLRGNVSARTSQKSTNVQTIQTVCLS